MAVWKVARLGSVSSLTGQAFPPDTEVVTALFGDEQEPPSEDKVRGTGFSRKDYLPEEATPERLAGAFCIWRTRTPPAKPAEERRLDLGMARDFLVRLLKEGREDRAAVCLTLALLLARKRRLHVLAEGGGTGGEPAWIEARWPKETETFRIPAPVVTEAEGEALQQELLKLFDV